MSKIFGPQIKKLQCAINEKSDAHILVNKTQYYSKDSERVLELIVIKQAVWDDDKQRFKNIELFSSASDIQIVLYLRDMWYELNGWEVPTDNEEWNKAKETYLRRHNGRE
jgi:hypothetical protein